MNIKTKPLLLIILLLNTGIGFSQSNKFIDICQGLKTDSILVIIHTKSTNASNNYLVYVCYKTNGEFYFKKHIKKHKKIKVNTTVNDSIKAHLLAFFNEKIFNKNDSLMHEQFYTDGTYNLLAIGVSEDHQRKGIASEMIHYIEQLLKQKEGRILIVETSTDDAQIGARKFYKQIGYTQEAVIRDFWKEGEDKIVFWKKL